MLKRLLIGLLIILLLAVLGFVVWAETPLGPMPEALTALESDALVTVETNPWMTFTPKAEQPTMGVILYPGGRVDPRAYAPLAHQIAAEGYLVVIPPMPLNLAVMAPNRAQQVIEAHLEVRRWVIGGHSLGGSMAANYIYNHPDAAEGLILWASYPAGNNSLKSESLAVLSTYGTEDMGLEGIEASPDLLPAQTQWAVIEGGNHAQFGWYGLQPGDGDASISREDQQTQILKITLDFLDSLQ